MTNYIPGTQPLVTRGFEKQGFGHSQTILSDGVLGVDSSAPYPTSRERWQSVFLI